MSSIRVAERRLTFEPPPAWADLPPFAPRSGPWNGDGEGGLRHWLVDDQIKAGDGPQTALVRRTLQVVNSDGLNGAASVELVFDPVWESAAVHFVRVIRDGRSRELPLDEAFEVFRRERDLERAKFDGRLTAHMIIPDLRVGDVVDYCFSITGENPVYRGLIAHWPAFEWSVRVAKVRFRLLTPPGRWFSIRYWGRRPDYAKSDAGGLVERTWSAEHVEAGRFEVGAPPEWIDQSRALIAEKTTWPRVAEIFLAGYGPQPLPDDLAKAADAIAARHADPKARTAEALRMVQGEVRYLAIAIGEGGLVPRPLADIWASRFGDCKDASRLLVAVLSRLGVEAAPALVNSRLGYGLDDLPPSLIAFDHCIVRARVGGATWWLDPTRSPQSGRLEKIHQARFGWALPLVPGAELEFMGEDEPVTVFDLRHDVRFGPTARSPARLEVRVTLRSWRADGLRRQIAVEGRQAVTRNFREFYENRFGALEVVQPLEIADREGDNEIETSEVYSLREPWTLSEDGRMLTFSTLDEIMGAEFPLPRTAERRAPIGLGWPRRAVQETRLHMPRPWRVNESRDAWTVGPIAAAVSLTGEDEGRLVRLRAETTVSGRVLPAKDARAYFDMAEKARSGAGVTLTHTAEGGDFTGATPLPLSGRKPWENEGGGFRAGLWISLVLLLAAAHACNAFGGG